MNSVAQGRNVSGFEEPRSCTICEDVRSLWLQNIHRNEVEAINRTAIETSVD
jgi:hypothetical protein